jgi:ethanolamine permease
MNSNKESLAWPGFREVFDIFWKPVPVGKYHLLALGILAVISGPFYSWNVGLKAGFGSFAIMTGLMGSAYSCFCYCASELSSAFPFAGGSYGLARCTLGYFLGYLTGCCEIMYYILLAAFINEGIAEFFMDSNEAFVVYHPLIIAIIYLSQILLISVDSRIFWRLVLLLTGYSLLIIVIYCLGSLGAVNFNRWAFTYESGHDVLFVGGLSQCLQSAPYSLYFYIGAELLNLTCNDVKNPRVEVPYGQVGTMIAMFVQSILVLFICCSLAPGTSMVQTRLAPLSDGE